MLVSALAGTEFLRQAYAEAVRERYRFYSYGDAMLSLFSRMLKKNRQRRLSLRSEAQRNRAYAFASSLAAALLDGLFEHPARCFPVVLGVRSIEFPSVPQYFSAPVSESKPFHDFSQSPDPSLTLDVTT